MTGELADTAIAPPPESGRDSNSTRDPSTSGLRRALFVLFAVCAVSFVAVLVATMRYGVGLTPDSVVYLDGARGLANGDGYVSDGAPITLFAPGYSAVLSLGEHVGISVETGARILAAIAFVATVMLGHVLLRRHIRSNRVIAVGTVAIGCSAVLLQTYKEALSEHLFIVVVLLFVLAAEECMRAPRALAPPVALVAFTWAAFYLRYAGIVFVPLAVAIVVIAGWSAGRRYALGRAGAVLAAGMALPALWMRRNVDEGSGLLGSRQDAAASPLTNVWRTGRELAGWLVTSRAPSAVLAVVLVVVAALLAAVVVLVVRGKVTLPADTPTMLPLGLVVVVYVTYLTVSASIVAFAAINTRFLAPVFVPLVVIGAWVYEHAQRQAPEPVRKVITGLAVAWLAISLVWFGAQTFNAARRGAGGFATTRWHNSRVLDDVRELDRSVPVYTNNEVAIELFTGRNVELSAEKTFFESNEETGRLPAFLRKVQCAGRVDLVWFLPNTRPRLYAPEELGRHLQLVPRVERRDGVIYDVSARPGDARPSDC